MSTKSQNKIKDLFKRYGVGHVEPTFGVTSIKKVSSTALPVEHSAQTAIGTTGTAQTQGQIEQETNTSYEPEYVRGSQGEPGLYEELYRSEPLIYDAVQSHTETLVSGTFELQMPELVRDEDVDKLQELVDFHSAKILNLYGGFDSFVEHAASFLIFGFAPFEVQWWVPKANEPDGRIYIHDLLFREQSIVHAWLFDKMLSRCVGCEFKATSSGSDDAPTDFTLMMGGSKLQDTRLIVANLGARGLNIEGVAPPRPSIHYAKMKKLLVQIGAIMAEKWGVPPTYVFEDATALAAYAQATDPKELAELQSIIDEASALDAPILALPGAVRIGQVPIQGTMPSLQELIDYCDRMILTPFSNEGSLLGLQSATGSYALGEVKERDTLRSAPYYARQICKPLNVLMRKICRHEIGELPAYPQWVWRMDGIRDNSKWVSDVQKFFPGRDLEDYPPAARDAVLEALGLPPDTFVDAADDDNGSEEE